MGAPTSFSEWWSFWLRNSPTSEDLDLVVCVLWVIWCSRNKTVFQDEQTSVPEALAHIQVIQHQLVVFRKEAQIVHQASDTSSAAPKSGPSNIEPMQIR